MPNVTENANSYPLNTKTDDGNHEVVRVGTGNIWKAVVNVAVQVTGSGEETKIGDGINVTFTLSHSFTDNKFLVRVVKTLGFIPVGVNISRPANDQVIVGPFAVPPSIDEYTVIMK